MKHSCILSVILIFLAGPGVMAQSGDADLGKTAFAKECGGCHSMSPSNNYYAPNLHCIIGKKAATADFSAYSDGFKDAVSEVVWSEDILSEYLASQREFMDTRLKRPDVPLMMNLAWPDAGLRANLIAYFALDCSS